MTIRPRHLCWAHDTSVADGVLSQAEDRLDFNSLPHLPLSPRRPLCRTQPRLRTSPLIPVPVPLQLHYDANSTGQKKKKKKWACFYRNKPHLHGNAGYNLYRRKLQLIKIPSYKYIHFKLCLTYFWGVLWSLSISYCLPSAKIISILNMVLKRGKWVQWNEI